MKKIMLLITLLYQLPAFSASIDCPAELSSHVSSAWKKEGVVSKSQKHPFYLSEIIQGKMGDEKSAYPSLLAPDKEIKKKSSIVQIWNFSHSTQPILLVCRYQNTSAYLMRQLPSEYRSCEQTLEMVVPNSPVPGGVIVKSLTCHSREG